MLYRHSISRAITIAIGAGGFSWKDKRIVGTLQELVSDLLDPYRPELHYMRGPGPRWREKHARDSARGAWDDLGF